MNVDEFAKWARTGGEPLRADDLTIQTPDSVFEAHGTLRVEDKQFLLKVTLHGDTQLPKVFGSISAEDFWKISGILEDRLAFHSSGIPHVRHSHLGRVPLLQATFGLRSLSFVTESTAEAERSLHDQLEALRKASGVEMPSTESASLQEVRHPRYWAYSRLPGFKVRWPNAGTETEKINDFLGKARSSSGDTFMARFGDFEYALINADNDCEFYLRSREGAPPVSEESFRETFSAFLAAIAFLHGRDAWPQHRRLTRDWETLEDEITPLREISETPLVLLNGTVCAHGSSYEDAMRCAVDFFLQDTTVASTVERFLYLCRQSSLRKTPLNVGTLSLCSILEGMVAVLHKHHAPTVETEATDSFQQAKAELLAVAKKREAEGEKGFERLIGILTSAKPLRPEDCFRQLVSHFNLPQGEMELALSAWKAERHSLAHGSEPSEKSGDRMYRQSRLAGGINLLAAGAMGYKGLVVFSALEDRYVRI